MSNILTHEDSRPARGFWAPGPYMQQCRRCSKTFIGNKHAMECAPCAYGPLPQWTSKSERQFTRLAWKEAEGTITAEELAKLEELSKIREWATTPQITLEAHVALMDKIDQLLAKL